MRRILLVALLAVGGSLAMAVTASANIGDAVDIEIDPPFAMDEETVTVEGEVECSNDADGIRYALAVKASQGNAAANDPNAFGSNGGGANNASAEGTVVAGPNAGAVEGPDSGVQDDQPCESGPNGQDFDVVVEIHPDSDDFNDSSDVDLLIALETSAEDGTRAADGAFIGDLEVFTGDSIATN